MNEKGGKMYWDEGSGTCWRVRPIAGGNGSNFDTPDRFCRLWRRYVLWLHAIEWRWNAIRGAQATRKTLASTGRRISPRQIVYLRVSLTRRRRELSHKTLGKYGNAARSIRYWHAISPLASRCTRLVHTLGQGNIARRSL
jgi:hypothetical protein